MECNQCIVIKEVLERLLVTEKKCETLKRERNREQEDYEDRWKQSCRARDDLEGVIERMKQDVERLEEELHKGMEEMKQKNETIKELESECSDLKKECHILYDLTS